ncbi:MAG: acyltransferase [Ruminococcus sp.]|nr:acyltransferase [Ruminococcus sp.]
MREKIYYIDRIKALACIAVVILHTFYAASAYASTVTEQAVLQSVKNLMVWSVPCFVMCSGALLLDTSKEISLKKIVKKYIPRMLIALLFFSIAFSCFDSIASGGAGIGDTLVKGLKDAFFGTGWKHMWYIYMMIAVYLMLPIYRVITKAADNNTIKYYLIICIFFLSLLPITEKIYDIKTGFYILIYSIYPMYLFLGYQIHNNRVRATNPVMAVMLGIFLISTIALTYYNCSNNNAVVSEILSNYASPIVVVGSAAMYGLIRKTPSKKLGLADTAAGIVSKCSFGVYLLHMAVLKYIFVVKKYDPFEHGGYFSIIMISILAFIISFVLTWTYICLKKKVKALSVGKTE